MSAVDTRTLSELFELLSHPRRRFVLHALQGSRRAIDTGTLARGIAAWEATDSVGPPTPFVVDAVTVSLHHTHLPRLVDADLLDYDAGTGRVEPGERTPTDLLLDDELRLERESVLAGECDQGR